MSISKQAESASETQPVTGAPEDKSLRDPRNISRLLSTLRLGRYSGVALFAILIAVFSLLSSNFMTSTTWSSIATAQAVTAILALGLLFPLSAGAFDLSVAQNAGFCAALCAALMVNKPHLGVVPAVAITIAAGGLVGVFNGFIVGIVGVDSFIATLGTTSLLTAGVELITNNQYLDSFPSSFTGITSPAPFGIPIVVYYLAVFAVIAWVVLEHTALGRRLSATGANPEATRLAGVNTRRFVIGSFIVCGLAAGVAGVLLSSMLGTINESIGPQYLLPAFAGVFLGSTQIKPGRFNVWGTILALYLLGTGVEGLQLLGGSEWVTDLFNGVALIGAVSVAILLDRWRGRRDTTRGHAPIEEDVAAARAP
jgi:ribose transport system permease protein